MQNLRAFWSFVIVVFSTVCALAQPLQREWVRSYAHTSTNINGPVAIAVGPDGNVVVAGSSQNPEGDFDYEVIKYRPNGDEAWEVRYGSSADDQLRGMTIDPSGNIIVTGTTDTVKYTADGFFVWVAPGESMGGRALIANSNFVYVTGLSDTNIVTAQLDIDGNEVWRRVIDGPNLGQDIGQVITLDTNGNVYVAGQLEYTGCGPRQACHRRLAAVSYSPAGDQRWFSDSESTFLAGTVNVNSILVLPDQSVYLYGSYDAAQPYIAKFDSDGKCSWHNYFFRNFGTKMTFDRTSQKLVGTGRWNTSVAGVRGAMAISFSGTETIQSTPPPFWTYSGPPGGLTEGSDIVQNSQGSLYIAGHSHNGYSTNGFATYAMFLAKINPSGKQLGLDRYNHPNAVSTYATALAVDAIDNVYVTGYLVNAEGGTEIITAKYTAPPKIERKAGGPMQLRFHTSPGLPYAIEASTNFLNWLGLTTNVADANGLVQFEDTNAVVIPYRVYRGKAP